MYRKTIVVLITFILAGCLFGCKKTEVEKPQKTEAPKASSDKAKVELYIMSQCPYGVLAMEAMLPAIEKLGSAVELDLGYIGRVKPDGSLDSMHGESEVEGDILQLCAGKAGMPQQFKFIACQNENWRSIPKDWEKCAGEAGIEVEMMKKCKDGEGKKLLSESFERANKAGAMGSPTIKLNGEPYKGGRKTQDFMREICKVMGDAPKACKDIPKPAVVNVVAISDKRCKECEPKKIVESLKEVFPGLEPQYLDWSEAKAQAIAKEAEVKLLPVVLFDESLDKDKDGASRLAQYLDPAGKYKSLRVGATFDPAAEICDNGKDDTGDGKADCDDSACKDQLVCREEKKGQLDVFVMSQCPYGVLGLDAMKAVLDAFKDEITFNVNYIAEEKEDGTFDALHGQPEVDENIRELCAIEHYPDKNKYMEYIWCRNKSIRSPDWQSCTGKNGIDTKVIEKCFNQEGKKLLSKNIKLGQVLKVHGSPTWLINNRETFNAIDAAEIQKKICEKNPDLKGCKASIAPNAQAAPQGSCG